MNRLRLQYQFYTKTKKQNNFKNDFPEMAEWIRLKQRQSNKNQANTFSHWFLLALFGGLTIASFSQQLLLIVAFILVAALVKGPAMILYGVIYTFLVGLFPPLGIVLSALFFFIHLYQITRNWRFGLAAGFFYLYPVTLVALRQFAFFDRGWLMILLTGIGLLVLHFLFQKVYWEQPSSKGLAWSILSLPYDCLSALIPVKRKPKKFRKK